MKKLIAATLLTIYLFNLGGALAMHQYFSFKSEEFFNEQTARGLYNIHDLTEIKVPVNMPGISDWKNYENIKGQVQFANSCYNYVKMKITRNYIYLMCLPNYDTTRLLTGNIIDARGITDIPVPKKDHVPYGKSIVSVNFNFAFTQFAFCPWFKTIKPQIVPTTAQITSHSPTIPEQPPQLAC